MPDIKIGYALWNHRDQYQGELRDLLIDIDLSLDSIIEPYVNSDLMSIIAYMADNTACSHAVIYASGTAVRQSYLLDSLWLEHCGKNWLVSGHIMLKASAEYPCLHEQAFAINLELWKSLGRPEIGYPENGSKLLPAYARSSENIHDDYTPLWIKANDQPALLTNKRKFGWNIIAASLANGFEIPNLSIDIRKQKLYVYPDDNGQKLTNAVKILRSNADAAIETFANSAQQAFVDSLRFKLQDPSSSVYIHNTGLLWWEGDHRNIIPDTIWTTASGFKSFIEWYMRGAPAECSIETYDFNIRSIKVWQHIHANWDGNNLYDFMHAYDSNCDSESLYCWGNKQADESIKQCSDRQEQDMTGYFGSRENFHKHWKLFQALQHRYHCLNIVTEHAKLVDQLKPNSVNCIWVNNIFFFRQNMLQFGTNNLNSSLEDLADAIDAKSPDTYLFGQCSKMYFGDRAHRLAFDLKKAVDHKHQWDLNRNL
jgi:hypothetical protein